MEDTQEIMSPDPVLLKAQSYRLDLTWLSLAQNSGCQPQLDPLHPPQPHAY